MKKIFSTAILITFLLGTAYGQYNLLTLSGQVIDITTGTGIGYKSVSAEIMNGGFMETYELVTNNAGFYIDSIAVLDEGSFNVYTLDCLGNQHIYSDTFGPGNYAFNYDFMICTDSLQEGCYASFAYGLPPQGGNIASFENLSTGNPTGWSWSFGDGSISQEWSPVHEYASEGNYMACLTIWSDDSLCYDNYCQNVVVGSEECENFFWYETWTQLDFVFVGESTPSPANYYFWDFGDGSTGNGQTTEHIYEPLNGMVTVTLVTTTLDSATGDTCQATSSQEVWVGGQGSECSNWFLYETMDGYTFNFMGDGTPEVSAYLWDFGDGTTATGQNIQHIYEPGYDEPVTVSLTTIHSSWGTADSCIATSFQFVTIGDSVAGCENFFWYYPTGEYTYYFAGEAYPIPADEYFWDFGDGQTSTGPELQHTFDPDLGESFQVTLTTFSYSPEGDSCIASSTQQVWISNAWDCENWIWYETWDFTTFNFYGEAFPYPADEYYWDLGDGTTATGPEFTHTYVANTGDVFQVSLTTVAYDTATGDSCIATSEQQVIIGGDSTGCENTFWYESTGDYAFEFFAESFPFPTDLYFWDFGDGSTASGQNVTHTFDPSAGDVFEVCLTTFAMESVGDSCIAVSCKEVNLSGQSGKEIFGTLYLDNIPVDMALIGLFGADPNNVYYEFTLTESGTGSYFFENIPEGEYYIFTTLMPQSAFFYDYFPTYYGDAIFWFEAELIAFGNPSNPYDIHLVPMDGASNGPCAVTGTVSMEDGKGGPGQNVAVMLMDSEDNALDYTSTNELGEFIFEDLAYGSYKLTVEMAGVISETAFVELDDSNLSAELHFFIQDNNAYLGLEDPLLHIASLGEIFPNPVSSDAKVNVEIIEKTNLIVQVISQSGQLISSGTMTLEPGKHLLNIESSALSPGLYFMQILGSNGKSVTRKFIK